MRVIDFHNHYYPPKYMQALRDMVPVKRVAEIGLVGHCDRFDDVGLAH